MNTKEIVTKDFAGRIIKKDVDSSDYDIAGMITTFGVPDLVGDVIVPSALDKFIDSYNATMRQGVYDTPLPMYFQHSTLDPIGYWIRFEKTAEGVIGYGKFYDTTRGQDVRKMTKDENSIIGGFSIGFTSNDYEDIIAEDKWVGYKFNEITLRETSIVINPAMPSAKITNVKNAKHKDGTINLAVYERSLREAGATRSEAKGAISALKDYLLIHIEMKDEDEEEAGEMPADDTSEDQAPTEQVEAQKLLDALKSDAELRDILKSLKGN